jgi:hypothetical protein
LRPLLFAAAALLAFGSASIACAEIVHFTAKLDGAQETPPNPSKGTGKATVDLDTGAKTVTWTVTYSGLSGPAVAAHIHGPAAAGKAAGVVIPLTGPLASPISGGAAVNDGQIGDLRAGLWYINIHTAKVPGGEIRGQVEQAH